MQVIIFQKELYAYHWTIRKKKNICILSSHRATRELYAKVLLHRAPVEGSSMRLYTAHIRTHILLYPFCLCQSDCVCFVCVLRSRKHSVRNEISTKMDPLFMFSLL